MSMNKLPTEMIREITGYLQPSDRLNSSLVSRTWAEAISTPYLLRDVILVICGMEMETVVPTILQSTRRYRNVRIIGAVLSQITPALWAKLGGDLRQLELIECFIAPVDLYAVLRHCSKLESLALTGYSEGSAGYSTLEQLDDNRLDEVRNSLLNMRHLRTDFHLTGQLLDQLLGIMPNVTSLSVKFDPPIAHQSLQLMPCIFGASRTFTRLDIGAVQLTGEDFLKLVRTHAGTVEHLELNCSSLTADTLVALSNCTRLRLLSLDAAFQFGDDHMRRIAQSARDLETLKVSNSESLTDVGLAYACDFEKLLHLSLFWCLHLTSNAVRELRRFPNLQHLDLQGITVDFQHFKTIGRLKDLRSLILTTDIDSKMFDIICRNLVKLTKLQLGSCERLTDRDVMKLTHLRSLKCLSLLGCVGITDLSIGAGLQCLKLECLTLDGSPLTDVGLASIGAHQGRLRTLELLNCAKVTDEGLIALLHGEQRLETLALESCRALTRRSLNALERTCPRLEWLEIDGSRLNVTTVDAFRERRPFVSVESDV